MPFRVILSPDPNLYLAAGRSAAPYGLQALAGSPAAQVGDDVRASCLPIRHLNFHPRRQVKVLNPKDSQGVIVPGVIPVGISLGTVIHPGAVAGVVQGQSESAALRPIISADLMSARLRLDKGDVHPPEHRRGIPVGFFLHHPAPCSGLNIQGGLFKLQHPCRGKIRRPMPPAVRRDPAGDIAVVRIIHHHQAARLRRSLNLIQPGIRAGEYQISHRQGAGDARPRKAHFHPRPQIKILPKLKGSRGPVQPPGIRHALRAGGVIRPWAGAGVVNRQGHLRAQRPFIPRHLVNPRLREDLHIRHPPLHLSVILLVVHPAGHALTARAKIQHRLAPIPHHVIIGRPHAAGISVEMAPVPNVAGRIPAVHIHPHAGVRLAKDHVQV